jgi:tRNA G18 (ribose-2'-O)-methylase SpoU
MKTEVLKIDSESNATFKMLLSLTGSKGIKKESLFLISGDKIIREALKLNHLKIVYELATENIFYSKASKKTILAKTLFNDLDVIGTGSNILVAEVPEIKPLPKNWNQNGFCVFLPLGDPVNLGSAIRSCKGFNVDQLVLLTESANPFLPKVTKSSAGANLSVQFFKGPSINELSDHPIVCMDKGGEDLNKFKWQKNISGLLLGQEGSGIPQNLNIKKLSISATGVESLNATSALSIALFHRQYTS